MDRLEHAINMGLSKGEYEYILKIRPDINILEISMLSGMWSEHCSYKSTKMWLKKLPTKGKFLVEGPGGHAGVISAGDGWTVSFKIESHNHPSAIDPFHGAATGVGGIIRDIIASGHRPVAIMDALHFGKRDYYIDREVIKGIAWYGNSFGIANIGGKTIYDKYYLDNPLVNVMCIGIARYKKPTQAICGNSGNYILYVGARTGKDGVGAASFASEVLTKEVSGGMQIGDPYGGRNLMEACLSFTKEDGLIGCQDMGACGLLCASSEMSSNGKHDVELYIDKVPISEELTPEEILLSETQERFLFSVKKDKIDKALEHFGKFVIEAKVIGKVLDNYSEEPNLIITEKHKTVACISAKLLANDTPLSNWDITDRIYPSIKYHRRIDYLNDKDYENIYSRYDQTIGNLTVVGPGHQVAIQRLPNSKRGYAVVITSRPDLCKLNPYEGSYYSVYEAIMKLSDIGSTPVGITNCLNMPSPEESVNYGDIIKCILGIKKACIELGVPVTGGNVSLYNQTLHSSIPPTPVIGAVGLVDNIETVKI